MRKLRRTETIVLAWLVAGTLDATAAVIQFMLRGGKNPLLIFRYIASGLFGKNPPFDALTMAGIGLVFHYLFALAFSIFFFLLFPFIKRVATNLIVTGLIYGIFAWIVMNLIVVPLSLIHKLPLNFKQSVIGLLILMFCIGLPIALIIGNYYRKENKVVDNGY